MLKKFSIYVNCPPQPFLKLPYFSSKYKIKPAIKKNARARYDSGNGCRYSNIYLK